MAYRIRCSNPNCIYFAKSKVDLKKHKQEAHGH